MCCAPSLVTLLGSAWHRRCANHRTQSSVSDFFGRPRACARVYFLRWCGNKPRYEQTVVDCIEDENVVQLKSQPAEERE
jgi:hypothetical protein